MEPDLWKLYRIMLQSRLFEEAVLQLWSNGEISGEMHLAIGEEAIAAGILSQIQNGDALALDHRGTPQLLMRGVDPVILLKEFLGAADGLCGGQGGHMHLFSSEHLAMSSGIVGASAPAALGFAISAEFLRPGKIAVAFMGEGAVNQGMVMESFNMAAAWELPVLFVCKDNQWSITTQSDSVRSGSLTERAKSFGMPAWEIDGSDVVAVWKAASHAISHARDGEGPSFMLAQCMRPEGHFIGDPLIRISRRPVKEMKKIAGPLIKSVTKIRGSSIAQRSQSLGTIYSTLVKTVKEQIKEQNDPLKKCRELLKSDKERLQTLENRIKIKIQEIVEEARQPVA